MSSKPTVSVIIPTYNSANFIGNAVQSVLDQTDTIFEIIVVDDGSTDDTPLVLEPFKDKIRYLATENRGAAHARNTGMKAASGKYIAFLDADDLYLPGKLALQVDFIEAYPEVDIVATEASSMVGNTIEEKYHLRSYHRIYNRNGWSYEDLYPARGHFHCKTINVPVPYYVGEIFNFTLQGPVLFSTTVLFNKNILNVVGYQNEAYRNAQEYELLVRICKYYKVGFLDIPTYIYRYHDNQISMEGSQISVKKILTQIRSESVFLQAVLDWGFEDKEYYIKNKDLVNHRIAELYHCIGNKWMEINEISKARENYLKGRAIDPAYSQNIRKLYFSYLPGLFRRGVNGFIRKVTATK
jgi:glycosyltransferase involved in cell wall biosynthesis